MRLQAEHAEVALNAALGNAGFGRDAAHAPMRAATSRAGVQRRLDQLGDALVIDAAWLARPGVVMQAVEAVSQKAAAPLPYRLGVHIEFGRRTTDGGSLGALQHDARAHAQA